MKADIHRVLSWNKQHNAVTEDQMLNTEWLVSNGLGGYASGTVCGTPTRRYHGLLIASVLGHSGRMMLINHVHDSVMLTDGNAAALSGTQRTAGEIHMDVCRYLKEFRLEWGLPVWIFETPAGIIEKRLMLIHGENTLILLYRLLEGSAPVTLQLRPLLHMRGHGDPLSHQPTGPYEITIIGQRIEIHNNPPFPTLRLRYHGNDAQLIFEKNHNRELYYRVENHRGYPASELLWNFGYFSMALDSERDAALMASVEQWPVFAATQPHDAFTAAKERAQYLLAEASPVIQQGFAPELVLAADQFIIRPQRVSETKWTHAAADDEPRTIIAGYHWFTDWGRDTMISLEGLTMLTGRLEEARRILSTFAHHVRNGLIPNLFPEGKEEGVYHTADATLWFFHAFDRYMTKSNDFILLDTLYPILSNIIEHHLMGTDFGIGADPADYLLQQGMQGYQLTWMDAKVGDWVVTPRRGKAVEINALWYNALQIMKKWSLHLNKKKAASRYEKLARTVKNSFNTRFWYQDGAYLYDIVDGEQGEDHSCRPNQIFAVSLPYPVLDSSKWTQVVQTVQNHLLTPVGLRSLSPKHPEYKSRYFGELRARDAAYHQGTVWPWLIGPFIDAWLKVHPGDKASAYGFIQGLADHLNEACIGNISEIFDGNEPYTPRGCIAQAWSVAEVLRAWLRIEQEPPCAQL